MLEGAAVEQAGGSDSEESEREWQRPCEEAVFDTIAAPDDSLDQDEGVQHSVVAADAAAAMAWTASIEGQDWLSSVQATVRRQKDEAARAAAAAQRAREAAMEAAAELIQLQWRLHKYLQQHRLVGWVANEGGAWISALLDECLVTGGRRAEEVSASCGLLQRAVRCHNSRRAHTARLETQRVRRAGIVLSARARTILWHTRMRNLRELLPAVFKRRPFVRVGHLTAEGTCSTGLADTRPGARCTHSERERANIYMCVCIYIYVYMYTCIYVCT